MNWERERRVWGEGGCWLWNEERGLVYVLGVWWWGLTFVTVPVLFLTFQFSPYIIELFSLVSVRGYLLRMAFPGCKFLLRMTFHFEFQRWNTRGFQFYRVHKISPENLSTFSLISDIRRKAEEQTWSKTIKKILKMGTLFCLLPTFLNQHSKDRTHSTATK
jgi:hypothetical protein